MNYYFYNTDAKSLRRKRRIHVLLEKGLAITGGPVRFGEKLRQLTPDDVLLMYENGTGVVAVGKVEELWDGVAQHSPIYYVPGHSIFAPPNEYRIKVNWYLNLSDSPITIPVLRQRLHYLPRGTLKIIVKRRPEIERMLQGYGSAL